MTRRSRIGIALLALLATQVVAASASAAHLPADATSYTIQVVPLTGSSEALIYGEYSSDPAEGGELILEGVVVRHVDGTEQRLAYAPTDSDPTQRWSMAATTVTALYQPDDSVDDTPAMVLWWDVAAGTSGELAIHDSYSYVGAAPGGVLYLSRRGRLKKMNFAGTSTTWARVVPYRPTGIVSAVSAAHGVVVGGPYPLKGRDAKLRYVAFAHPQRVVFLDLTAFAHCWSLTRRYAGCVVRSPGHRAQLVPLDGSKPTPAGDRAEHTGPVAIAGHKTLVWIHDKPQDPYAGLGCRSGASTSRDGGGPVGWPPVRGLGRAVTSTPDHSRLEITTRCPKRTELPAPLPLS